MVIRKIRIVCSEKVLKAIDGLPIFMDFYEKTNKIVHLKTLGIELNKRFKINLKDDWKVDLFLFRNQKELDEHFSNAPSKAKRILNTFLKVPEEPYQIEVFRPKDMYITNDYQASTRYDGYWTTLDINSAEPYILTKLFPELEKPVKKLYSERNLKKHNKLTLVCLNGHLRNSHPTIYKTVCNLLYAEMKEKIKVINKSGAKVFALRRDALIIQVPSENWKPPNCFKIGEELGEWKMDPIEKGWVQTFLKSDYNFDTNLKKIKPRLSGIIPNHNLQKIVITRNGVRINWKG